MNEYFNTVVSRIKAEDILLLNILAKEGSTAVYKALPRSRLTDLSELTEANFRKVLHKLQALCFIEIDNSSKESLIYLTSYGLQAQGNTH